jgi:hypothetical protein
LSIPTIPEPAKLVISVLSADEQLITNLVREIETEFGPPDEIVGPLEFKFTSYYDKELGSGILRWIWSFDQLLDRGRLAEVKRRTNEIELKYAERGARRFNLDPGFLTLGNFVLATGKNNAHRIYLAHGIFADLTLIFRSKSFQPLEWTYPDYADSQLIQILNKIRESYKCQLTAAANPI